MAWEPVVRDETPAPPPPAAKKKEEGGWVPVVPREAAPEPQLRPTLSKKPDNWVPVTGAPTPQPDSGEPLTTLETGLETGKALLGGYVGGFTGGAKGLGAQGPGRAREDITRMMHLKEPFTAGPEGEFSGMIEPGNINLKDRPQVEMPGGDIATVHSKSFNIDGQEVLLPSVSDDGRLMNDDETVAQYRKTGKFLGKFQSPEEADVYATYLSQQQGKYFDPAERAALQQRRKYTKPESLERKIEAQRPMAETPAKDTALYKFGTKVESMLPQSSGRLNPTYEQFVGGLGSVLYNATLGLIPVAGVPLSVASVAAQGGGEAAERAIKKNASEQQTYEATQFGGIPGATDLIDSLLPRLGPGGKAAGVLARTAKSIGKKAGFEAAQEGIQERLQNEIALRTYDPTQNPMQNVWQSAILGGLVGGASHFVLPSHGGRAAGEAPHVQARPEDLDIARQAMAGTAPDETGQQQFDFTAQPPPEGTPVQVARLRTGNPTVSDAPEPGIPPSAPPSAPVGQPPSGVAPGAPSPAPQPGQESTIINEAVPSNFVPVTPETPEINPLTGQVKYPSLQENNPPGGVPQVFPGGQLFPQVQSDIGITKGVPDFRSGYPANENPDQSVAMRIAPRAIQSRVANEPDPAKQQAILDGYQTQEQAALTVDADAAQLTVLQTDPTQGKSPPNQTGGIDADYMDSSAGPHIVPNKIVQVVPQGLGSGPVEIALGKGGQPFILNSLHTATVGDWIQDIHPDPIQGGVNALVHRLVSDRLRQVVSHVKVHIVTDDEFDSVRPPTNLDPEEQAMAVYMIPASDRHAPFIMIRQSMIDSPRRMAHLILHEATHAATMEVLDADPRLRAQMNAIKNEVLKGMDPLLFTRFETAFKDAREFVAEVFSNPRFQHYLAQREASGALRSQLGLDGPRPNLWQAFAKRVQRALGLSNDTFSLLEATLRLGDRVIDVQANLPGSRVRDDKAPYVMGLKENHDAIKADDPESEPDAVGQNPAFVGTLDAIFKVFGGKSKTPIAYQSMAGHADKMNHLYRWYAGLDQTARANSDFKPIIDYTGEVQTMHLEEVQMHDLAVGINKEWTRLGERGDFLSQFIDEMAHMRYRSQAEIQNGIVRHPTKAEFNKLAAKYNLDQAALALFNSINISIVGDLQQGKGGFLGRIERSITDRIAENTQDPALAAKKIATIRAQVAALRSRPYFPFTNFGRHYVLVQDPTGRIIDFQTVEAKGLKAAALVQKSLYNQQVKMWKAKYGVDPVKNKDISIGILPKHVAPMIGMPGVLLEDVADMLKATPAQLKSAKWLQAAEAANKSPILASKYQKRFYVPGFGINDVKGYSMNLRRSYARFFFHGAKFYTRTKYLNKLEGIVRQAEMEHGNKEAQVAAYMRDHLENTIKDARGDWGWAKGGIFIWTMGYSPAAASQNLSQVPMITFPFLAAKFGDTKLVRLGLAKAMNQVTRIYKKGGPGPVSAFEAKALTYGIKSGRISETQAPEIAAMSQNRLLQSSGNKAQRFAHGMMQNSAVMFETMEQFNRRVTWRAALDLALTNPKAKYIDQAVKLHQTEFDQLITGTAPGAEGQKFTAAEARAVIAAVDVIEQTQFVYARWARPRFMRGGLLGTLFVFKKYVQSVLFMLGQNPDVAIRFLGVAAFIGGLTNLPFAEDFLGILNVIMRTYLGRDWNAEREIKRYMHESFGDDGDYADLILHGIARKGFGIPALLDLMGSYITGTPGRGLAAPSKRIDPKTGELKDVGFAGTVPLPVLDRSRALGQGHISPFDIGRALDPGADINRTIAQTAQNASGAVFSVGFNIYKAWADNTYAWNDVKRYEHAVPRLLGDVSQAFRSFREGRERIRGGPESGTTVLNYDIKPLSQVLSYTTRDVEQMMEILAIAAGYNTERSAARWDFIMAGIEARSYWDAERKGLLNQLNEAAAGGRQEDIDRVSDAIQAFNARVPERARGQQIGDETIKKSVEGRIRAKERQEAGWPAQKKDEPLYDELRGIFGNATIDVRKPAGQ